MRYKKTSHDFMQHLNSQIKFLKLSSKSYDDGFEDEAQRLAATIRVLLHDTSNSTSLLKHMNLKNNLYFISSAPQLIPANMITYTGLVSMKMQTGVGGKYYPNLNTGEPFQDFWLTFDDWWNQIVIDDKKNILSRRDLIRYAANEDGGSHVDESLNEKYSNLKIFNSAGWYYSDSDVTKPFDNDPIYPSIRQIAEELTFSLEWHLNTKNYTRSKTNHKVGVCYINEHIYMHRELNTNDFGDMALFKDDRVERREQKSVYKDTVYFKNNRNTTRNIIV